MKYVLVMILLCSGLVCKAQVKNESDSLLNRDVKSLQLQLNDLRTDVQLSGRKRQEAMLLGFLGAGFSTAGVIVFVKENAGLGRAFVGIGAIVSGIAFGKILKSNSLLRNAGAESFHVGIGQNGVGMIVKF